MVYDEAALREKREELLRDQAALEATGQLRSDRDSKRVQGAAEEASSSNAVRNEAIGSCFVSRPSEAAGVNEHVLRRIFLDEEKLASKSGKAGVSARELKSVLEACTGCVPSVSECKAMMAGSAVIDVDMFLLIYRNIQSGILKFENLSRTMSAFEALCHSIPDTA